jgi:hypothetical protein
LLLRSTSGDDKFKGIPLYFVHTDTGAKHHGVADVHGMVKMTLPPGTYALSVDMQVLVIPNPNTNKRRNPKSHIVRNAKQSIVATDDLRSEIFIRCDGNRAVAKRKHFIMQVRAIANKRRITCSHLAPRARSHMCNLTLRPTHIIVAGRHARRGGHQP